MSVGRGGGAARPACFGALGLERHLWANAVPNFLGGGGRRDGKKREDETGETERRKVEKKGTEKKTPPPPPPPPPPTGGPGLRCGRSVGRSARSVGRSLASVRAAVVSRAGERTVRAVHVPYVPFGLRPRYPRPRWSSLSLSLSLYVSLRSVSLRVARLRTLRSTSGSSVCVESPRRTESQCVSVCVCVCVCVCGRRPAWFASLAVSRCGGPPAPLDRHPLGPTTHGRLRRRRCRRRRRRFGAVEIVRVRSVGVCWFVGPSRRPARR